MPYGFLLYNHLCTFLWRGAGNSMLSLGGIKGNYPSFLSLSENNHFVPHCKKMAILAPHLGTKFLDDIHILILKLCLYGFHVI